MIRAPGTLWPERGPVSRLRAATLTALMALTGTSQAEAQVEAQVEDGDGLVQASLGAEFGAVWPGKETTLAVVLQVSDGWHIYWKNPGDGGIPTTVTLDLPPGLEAGEVQWPAPRRYVHEGMVSYGYEGEVTLLVPLRAAADLAAERGLTVRGRVEWLVCNPDGCLPGGAEVETRVHVASGPAAPMPTPAARKIAAARRLLPSASPPQGLRASWAEAERGLTLVLEVPGATALTFLPHLPEQVPPEDMATRGATTGARLEVPYPARIRGQQVTGVLAVTRGDATTHHEVTTAAPR